MAEIAAASSIVSLIDFSGKLLAIGYGFLAKVARAPVEIRMLLSDVANINTLLDRMQSLANDQLDPNTRTTLQSLTTRGTFTTCESLLKTAEKCLEACKHADGQQLKNFGRALKWPLMEREMKDTMQQLRVIQEQLSTALTVDSAATLRRIEASVNEINGWVSVVQGATNDLISQERLRELMLWIAPDNIDPDDSYESALGLRQSATGRWFLMSTQFRAFLGGPSGLFWIYGNAGCGKTILATTIIEHLQETLREPEIGLVYFYCDHRNHKKQLLSNFLSLMLVQLLKTQQSCISEIEAAHTASKCKLTGERYMKITKAVLAHFKRVLIVVDALDESLEEEAFAQAFADLLQTAANSDVVVQVILTSREDLNIERSIAAIATSRLSLVNQMEDDIRAYISFEVSERLRTRKMKLADAALAGEIVHSLVERAEGIFLQAKVQLDYISALMSDGAIKKALLNLPSGLDSTYEQILKRILSRSPEDAQVVKLIFLWLVRSYHHLTLQELAEAVSIQMTDTRLNFENVATDPEDLVALCGSLVIVDRTSKPPLVSLAHYSVEEYLCSAQIAQSPVVFFHVEELTAHLHLAAICIRYLSFDDFGHPQSSGWDARQLTKKYALLQYAARYWAAHLRDSRVSAADFQSYLAPILYWFCEPGVNGQQYSCWQRIFHMNCKEYEDCTRQPPFYNAIGLGLDHVLRMLLPGEVATINKHFSGGWTPLTAAITAKQLTTAKILLDVGADPNVAADEEQHKGLTALHIAAEQSMEEMVELLLSKGANIHARTVSETTPFYRAARGGSLSILQMLYSAGSDINARTWDGWTPLFEAVACGHIGIVRKLLQWGADCKLANSDGLTPYDAAMRLRRHLILQLMRDPASAHHDVTDGFCDNDME